MPDTPDDETLSQSAVQAYFASIGPYRLVQMLGVGGMGEVWRAEQAEPIHRTVALKLIKAGMDTKAVVARFNSERQALALMDHPNIAKVFDAGATPAGRPYFVMEYVPGIPITDYCDKHRLTINERLGLFIQVCEAVQHAHQKAIIHRDLKPSNMLVEEVDNKPVPKIIDFGLAKATGPRLTEMTMFTEVGAMLGTPDYMSPEQADRIEHNIDTRTDVYSLGMILYELLVGVLPFASQELRGAGVEAMLQKICQQEPPRPSTKLRSLGESAKDSAGKRREELASLERHLRGDLDWITLKALEKDRTRRYGAPSELVSDIRRYLNQEPVVARPTSAGYRLHKYARRHRVAVGVAAGLVLLFAVFFVLEAVELRRITRERDRANRERDRATRITDFMTGMFKVSDPNEARGNSVTAREILDKASNDMGTGLARDPEVQSQLMQVMARTYVNLGLYARAHELAKRALDARSSLFGPDDRRTLESMTQLGWILDREGHDAEAEKLERQALVREGRILGPEDPLTLETMDHLAVILENQGHYDEEEKLERQVIEIETRRLGPESAQTLLSMNNLGSAFWKQGRYADAEQEYRQLLDVARRVWEPDHPEILAATYNLALAIKSQGRFAEAEQLYRKVLASDQRVLGPEHPNTAIVMESLAIVLAREGRLADAEKLHRDTLGIRLRTLGPEHPDTLLSKYNVADLLFREGHVHEAEKLQRETIAAQVRALGPENPDTLASQSNLARTLIRVGHYGEAEKIARQTFDVQFRSLGPQNPDTVSTLQQLGTAIAHKHGYSEATKLFRDAIEKESNSGGPGDHGLTWYAFACVAVAADHPDDALRYLREAINHGYKDADALVADDDLRNLRHNPRFQELITELRHR
jgi:eukaryotic-like serine/threonine-protein kinase